MDCVAREASHRRARFPCSRTSWPSHKPRLPSHRARHEPHSYSHPLSLSQTCVYMHTHTHTCTYTNQADHDSKTMSVIQQHTLQEPTFCSPSARGSPVRMQAPNRTFVQTSLLFMLTASLNNNSLLTERTALGSVCSLHRRRPPPSPFSFPFLFKKAGALVYATRSLHLHLPLWPGIVYIPGTYRLCLSTSTESSICPDLFVPSSGVLLCDAGGRRKNAVFYSSWRCPAHACARCSLSLLDNAPPLLALT